MKSDMGNSVFSNQAVECEYLSHPYICFKIIKDKDGIPSDAEIVFLNSMADTNLIKRKDAIGRRISQLNCKQTVRKWLKLYNKAVLTGSGQSDQFYINELERWFVVMVFVQGNENAGTILADITESFDTNRKLTQAEAKYRAIAESSPDMIMRISRDFRYIYVNPSVTKYTDVEPEEFIGNTNRDLGFEPQYCSRFEKALKKVFDNKKTEKFEWEFNKHFFDWNLIPEFNDENEVEAILSIGRDITEVTQKINELRASEKRYRILLESIYDGVCVIDREWRFILVNEKLEGLLQESKENTLGKKVANIIKDTEGSLLLKACRKVMETRRPETVIENTNNLDGRNRWFEASICPVPEGVMIISSDITARKNAEKQLIESEDMYKSLIRQSLDGIILMDEQGWIIEFNKGMEDITGLMKEDILNFHSADSQSNQILMNLTYCCNNGDCKKNDRNVGNDYDTSYECRVCEKVIIKPDGSTRYIQVLRYPVSSISGTYTCFLMRDVTDTKMVEVIEKQAQENERKLQEAMEYDRIRTEFFANLSHELRTPLNIVLSSIQLIDKYLIKEEDRRHNNKTDRLLKSAKQNCYRLVRMINNLIDVTKIDAGFFNLEKTNCNITNVIEEICMSVVEYMGNKSIELIFDTDVEEKVIACDPNMIERVMLNLLSNAVKFTFPGDSVIVNISNFKDYVIVSVKDTGIGIPEDKIGQIFERFVQVDKSMTRKHEGSGIGLSLVKSIIEMHEGSVLVKSEYGKGTEFIIKLPADLICNEDFCPVKSTGINADSRIETINIEFSDIYT